MKKEKKPIFVTYVLSELTKEFLPLCYNFEAQGLREKGVRREIIVFNTFEPDEYRNLVFRVPYELAEEFEQWFNSL